MPTVCTTNVVSSSHLPTEYPYHLGSESFGSSRPSVQILRHRFSNMYSMSTEFEVWTISTGRSSNRSWRGNPSGSPKMDSGSLISVTGTIREPSPDLWVLLICSPHAVSGGV